MHSRTSRANNRVRLQISFLGSAEVSRCSRRDSPSKQIWVRRKDFRTAQAIKRPWRAWELRFWLVLRGLVTVGNDLVTRSGAGSKYR